LTLREMDNFIRERQKEVSATTVNHDLTTLFTILRWAERESYIPHMPFSTGRLKPARAAFRVRTLSPEEERLILAHAKPYQQALIVAGLDAGMHRKEILNQDWKDVDFERNLITMTASKKGREGRMVPLTNRFREVLEGLPKVSDHVFTYNNKPILVDFKGGWYKVLKLAGVDHIRFHDLRATYGTRLEELDVAPAVCRALMGHKRKDAHDRYIRPTLPGLRAAIERLNAWLREYDLETTAFKKAQNAKVFRLNTR
jgi:integrase